VLLLLLWHQQGGLHCEQNSSVRRLLLLRQQGQTEHNRGRRKTAGGRRKRQRKRGAEAAGEAPAVAGQAVTDTPLQLASALVPGAHDWVLAVGGQGGEGGGGRGAGGTGPVWELPQEPRNKRSRHYRSQMIRAKVAPTFLSIGLQLAGEYLCQDGSTGLKPYATARVLLEKQWCRRG